MSYNAIGKKYPPETFAIINENLRQLRNQKGVSRKVAAVGAMVSVSTLRKLESENCSTVTVWRLFEVCAYYQVEPHTVLLKEYYANPDHLPPR